MWRAGSVLKSGFKWFMADQSFANFWRARSRLYRSRFLQANMRLTCCNIFQALRDLRASQQQQKYVSQINNFREITR